MKDIKLIFRLIAMLFVLFSLPIVALFFCLKNKSFLSENPSLNYSLNFSKTFSKNKKIDINYIKAYDIEKDKVYTIPLEEYVLLTVASEMPVTFEKEALLAQTIACRSYAISKMISNVNSNYDVILNYNYDQAYTTYEGLQKRWKENYDTFMKKLKEIVEETKSLVMMYDNEVITAYYHSTSSGMTQRANEVWQKDLPYLVPVISNEVLSPKKETKICFSSKEVSEKLKIPIEETRKIKVKEINESNYVKLVETANYQFTGSQVREKLNLDSSSFTINYNSKEDMLEFSVYGFGHGVGMSQYGANELAKEGKKYDEILKHYYNGIEIKKFDD